MTTSPWSHRPTRRQSAWFAAAAGFTALATAVALVPVDAVTTARSTIFDNLLGTTAAPTSTRLGVYDLSVAPTPPARFFADDVTGTLRFSTLDSGTEPILVNTGESLTYTITLPTGLGVDTLPADDSSDGWDTHWATTSATADETVITRTQTATTPHIETVRPETHELTLTADDTVQHLSEVQVDYDHPRVTSDSGTATTPVPAVSDTDWGIWNAAARPDAGDWFSPGTTGTVSFSTLDVRDPDVTETLTYDTGDTRTYTVELPLGLEHTATDFPDTPGFTSSVTSAPRPGGGTTVTITQTAERDVVEVEFRADTVVMSVVANSDLVADSDYSVTYAPAERHRSARPRQAGRLLATTEIPVGVHGLRSSNPTWGQRETDATELQFDTLPADSAAVEFDLQPGDQVVYTMLEGPTPYWSIRVPSSTISTPHFDGAVEPIRYESSNRAKGIRVTLTVKKMPEHGLYPSEVISVPVESAPSRTGVPFTFTTRLTDAYRSSVERQVHLLPVSAAASVTFTPPGRTYVPSPLHDGHGTFGSPKITASKTTPPVTTPGEGYTFRVTAPDGMGHTDYDLFSGVGWRLEKSSTSHDGVTITEYRVLAQTTTANAPFFRNQMVFTNDGLHGSLDGGSIRFELDGNGIFPDHEWTAALSGHRATDFGVWGAVLTPTGTDSPVFTQGAATYADLTITTLPDDVPSEDIPAGASATFYPTVIRIPNAPASLGPPGFEAGVRFPAYTDPASGWRFSYKDVKVVGDMIEVTVWVTRPVDSFVVPRVTVTFPRALRWSGNRRTTPGTTPASPTSGYGYVTNSGLVPPDFVDRTNDPGGHSHLSPEYVITPGTP